MAELADKIIDIQKKSMREPRQHDSSSRCDLIEQHPAISAQREGKDSLS